MKYLDILGSGRDTFLFQTFDDRKNKQKSLSRVLQGSLSQLKPELENLNKKGAGIFVTINESSGRKKSDVTALRAVFADLDEGLNCEIPLKPTIIVESVRGPHLYWLLEKGEPLEIFTTMQRSIANYFKSDLKVCDLSRVMRLPGFHHMKDPENPFMVTLSEVNEVKYTSIEIFKTFKPFYGKRHED